MMAAAPSLIPSFSPPEPVFQISWPFPVWQVRFDDLTGLVAVEGRDALTLQTNFAVFSGLTGQFKLPDYRPAKAWWLNLADVDATHLYLQGLAAKGVGRSAGIMAVEISTGQVKWEQPGFSFYALSPDAVLVLPAAGDSTELIGLNPASGTVQGSKGNLAAPDAHLALYQAQRLQSFRVPQHYPAENKYFADLKEFLAQKLGVTAAFAIDYLEYKNNIWLGYYLPQANGQKTYQLACFSDSGDLYWQEELEKDLPGIGKDSFFIFRDTLILIKNKNLLLGYAV